MTSINFAKLLAEERKKAKAAQLSGAKSKLPDLSLSRIIDASDESSISKYRVGSIPTVYYIPNFVTQQESDTILQHFKVYSHQNKWTKLKRRRLQNWGGIPSSRGMLPEALPPFLSEVCSHLSRCKVFDTPANHILLNEYAQGQGIMSHKDGPLYFPRVAILSLSGPAVIHFRKELRDTPSLSLYLHPRSLLIFQNETYTEYLFRQEVERDEITKSLANVKFKNSTDNLQSNPTTSPAILTETHSTKQPSDISDPRESKIEEDQTEDLELGSSVERQTRVSLTIRVVLNVMREDASPATQAEEEELRRIEKHWYNAINEVV